MTIISVSNIVVCRTVHVHHNTLDTCT